MIQDSKEKERAKFGSIFSWLMPDESEKWMKLYENQGLQRKVHQIIYKKDSPDVFMRGYGTDRFASLEALPGLGEFYVASEINSLKVFRIQPLSVTEFKGTEAELKNDPQATKLPPRKEPFELRPFFLVYSTRQLNTLQVFLKLPDSEARSSSYVSFIFLIFVALVLIYLLSKWRAFKKAKAYQRKKKIANDLNKLNS